MTPHPRDAPPKFRNRRVELAGNRLILQMHSSFTQKDDIA